MNVASTRPASRARARRLRGRGDADDQQRDHQRHDRHLQAVQPQGPDRIGPVGKPGGWLRPDRRGGDAEREPRDQREQDAGGLRHARFSRGRALWRAPDTADKVAETHEMARKYFGTDGIRGLTNAGAMTAEMAMKVGMAAGKHFLRGDHRHRVVIGKDTRLSGYMLESALVAGFTSVGMDVVLVGPMPTPAVAMLTRVDARRHGRDAVGQPQPLFRQRHQAVRPRRLQAVRRGRSRDRGADRPAPRRSPPPPISAARGATRTRAGATSTSPSRPSPSDLRLDGLKIVVDCANGAAYQVAPSALWELGAEVVAIGVDAQRQEHQRPGRIDRAADSVRDGGRHAARTSASRSTATPTG